MFKKLFNRKDEYKVREFLQLDEIPYKRFPLGKLYIFDNEAEARLKAQELYENSKSLLGKFIPVYKEDEYLGAGTVNYIHIVIYKDCTYIDSLHYYKAQGF